jgi:hypothetical protein
LKYVVHRLEVPDPDEIYQKEQEQNVDIVPLHVPAFQHDNAKVYGIIKQLVLEGPGCSYILPFDRTSDGRQAKHETNAPTINTTANVA